MNSTKRTILVTVIIIIILVATVAYENPRYDLTLFLTAVASSLTSNLIFDLILRKESTLYQSTKPEHLFEPNTHNLQNNTNSFFET